jgi:hypothetical protein
MSVALELSLVERGRDRVCVTVDILPEQDGGHIEGVALQLLDPQGRELCARVLLPIAGRVADPLALTVELRSEVAMVRGCRVVASAWSDVGEIGCQCPADPPTGLCDHVSARSLKEPDLDDVILEVLTDQEMAVLTRRFPFVSERSWSFEKPAVIEADEPSVADVLGQLDEETAAFLRGLLDDELDEE